MGCSQVHNLRGAVYYRNYDICIMYKFRLSGNMLQYAWPLVPLGNTNITQLCYKEQE